MMLNEMLTFFFCFVFSALVPLEELKEINFTKQYGIARDSEVLDILDTVARTKEVLLLDYVSCFVLYYSFLIFGFNICMFLWCGN